MEEILNCLLKASAQLELARLEYQKIKDSEMLMNEDGKIFTDHLGRAIKQVALAQMMGCIVTLNDELLRMERS